MLLIKYTVITPDPGVKIRQSSITQHAYAQMDMPSHFTCPILYPHKYLLSFNMSLFDGPEYIKGRVETRAPSAKQTKGKDPPLEHGNRTGKGYLFPSIGQRKSNFQS